MRSATVLHFTLALRFDTVAILLCFPIVAVVAVVFAVAVVIAIPAGVTRLPFGKKRACVSGALSEICGTCNKRRINAVHASLHTVTASCRHPSQRL